MVMKAGFVRLKQVGSGKSCPVTDLAHQSSVAIEMNCIAL
jgi:hypothetical protein